MLVMETLMKKRISILATFLLLPLGTGVAFAAPPDRPGNVAPGPGSKSENVTAAKDKLGHAVGVISAEMTTTTNGFVVAAAQSDMYEIQAARIAISRTHSAAVSRFANTMLKAHTKTIDDLKTILTSENVNVALPTVLDVRRQTLVNDLRGLKDADFDENYISQQVDAHEEALILMRGYHNSGDNKVLKGFAGTVENAVKMHLGMAQRLNKTLEARETAENH